MKGYLIGGVQQIGIGVENLEEAWKWYSIMFGMDCKIFDDDSEARIMLPYTGGKAQRRRAILALNLQSGGGFEIWQYRERKPVTLNEEIRLGDLGILACKIKVRDVDKAYDFYRKNLVSLYGEPQADPSGNRCFFLKDPYGNIFEIVKADSWFMDEGKISGGSYGAIIGVSSVENARGVYSDILGYDEVIYDKTGIFPDLANLAGGEKVLRRVLLGCSKPHEGSFSRLFGQSNIELICNPEDPGKRIFKDRFWGDPGFIHLCYDMRNIGALRDYCGETGFPFKVDSRDTFKDNSFDMGEAAGDFAYIEDPDGTLIEFVETHKLPILKKFGLYFNLKKRKEYKPLPDWLVKMLRFSKVRL